MAAVCNTYRMKSFYICQRKLILSSIGAFKYDYEAQEWIILYVGQDLRRALSPPLPQIISGKFHKGPIARVPGGANIKPLMGQSWRENLDTSN